MTEKCPICVKGFVTEAVETVSFTFSGKQLSVESKYSKCSRCGASITTPEQARVNQRASVRAKMLAIGMPSIEAIKNWRTRWGLKKAAAGKMLGLGPTAFSKYENYALIPSAPTIRLLIAVVNSEESTRLLGQHAGISLPPKIDNVETSANLRNWNADIDFAPAIHEKTLNAWAATYGALRTHGDRVVSQFATSSGIHQVFMNPDEIEAGWGDPSGAHIRVIPNKHKIVRDRRRLSLVRSK